MRTLSVVSSLDPSRGGTQSGAISLIRASQQAGVANFVVAGGQRNARRRAEALTAPLVEQGVVVKQFPTLPWPREAPDRWGLSPGLLAWMMRNTRNFDVVHLHGVWGLPLVVGLAVAKICGKPVVVTAHESLTSFDVAGSPTPLRRYHKLWLKRLYLRYVDLFVLTSRLEADESLPRSARERVRVVHYPLSCAREPQPHHRVEADGHQLRVGFLGRIHPKKQLDVLVEALSMLPGHIHLVVAGDGPDANAILEQIRRRGLESRITWRGFVAGNQLESFFASIDVLAMPSSFESFGMSAAEAMLRGLPVIVSERTGVAEVIRRHGGGYLVQPTAEALAAIIRQCDDNRALLGELGSAAQAAVAADLSYSQVGNTLQEVYESLSP